MKKLLAFIILILLIFSSSSWGAGESTMSLDPVLNFAKCQVKQGYASGITTIQVIADCGSNFPDPSVSGPYNVLWWNGLNYADASDDPLREIVRVTGRVADTFTISRAQETTTAQNHNLVGRRYYIALTPTKKLIDDLNAWMNTSTGHNHDGVNSKGITGTGDVVGPASTTENYIPQWDAGNKLLKDGIAVPIIDANILSASAWNAKEPAIIAGSSSDYWTGDKIWTPLNKAVIGLGNVENTALSTWGGGSNLTTIGILSGLTLNNTTEISILSQVVSDSYSQNLIFQRAKAGPAIVAVGQTIGRLWWKGYDGVAYQDLAQITGQVDGTPGANDMPGRIVFSTVPDGSTTLTEAMRISSNQNVGFNVSVPGAKISLRGETRFYDVDLSRYVGLKAKDTMSGDSVTWQLPDGDGVVGQAWGLTAAGTLGWVTGGTGMSNPMLATGDIIYSIDTMGTAGTRTIGSTGQCLIVSGGLPVWGSCTAVGSAAGAAKDVQFAYGDPLIFTADTGNLTYDPTLKTLTILGQAVISADAVPALNQSMFIQVNRTGLIVSSSYSGIHLNVGTADEAHDYNTGILINHYTLNGAGVSIGNEATGDGIFIVSRGNGIGLNVNAGDLTHQSTTDKAINVDRWNNGPALNINVKGGGTSSLIKVGFDSSINATILDVQNDKSATSDSIVWTLDSKTSGKLFNIYQATSAMSGDLFIANMGNSGGSFTGSFLNFAVADVQKFVVTAAGTTYMAGNLGVGISPLTRLHMYDTVQLQSVLETASASGSPGIIFERSMYGKAQVNASVTLGTIVWKGYDNASTYREVGYLRMRSDGTITSTSSPGYMVFALTPSGSVTPVEKMRLTSSGEMVFSAISYINFTSTAGASGLGIRRDPSTPYHMQYANSLGVWTDMGSGGSAHNLLSATHSDTTLADALQGAIIIGHGASPPLWTLLPAGTNGKVLTMVSSEPAWATPASGVSLFPASSFMTRSNTDGWADFVQVEGTYFDWTELRFPYDATYDIKAVSPPFRFTGWAGGNITVRLGFKTNATDGVVKWKVAFRGITTGSPAEAWEGSLTEHSFSNFTISGTAEYLKEATWTGAVSELAVNDAVVMQILKDKTSTLAVDAKLLYVEVSY